MSVTVFFYLYEAMLVLFQICFFLVLYTSSIILNNLIVYLTRSQVAGDVLLLCVNLLTHSCWIVFSCVLKPEGALSVEILWGLGLLSHLQEQSWFCFFQVSRSLGLLFILTSWHRGYRTRSVMYIWTLNLCERQTYSYIFLGETFPASLPKSRQNQTSFLIIFLCC